MRDYVIILAIAATLPFILARPWIGILVWSWIGFMNPHKLGWGLAAHLPIAVVVGGLTLLSLLFTKDKKSIPWSSVMIIMAAMVAFFTFTTFFSWVPDAAWIKWEKVMKVLLMSFVITMLIYGRFRIWALMMVIAISIGFYGFKGGIFSIVTGGNYKIWGPPASFIGGNTEIGLAMVMVLPIILVLAREAEKKWVKYALYATFWLTVIATIFTYSRGALLGLATVMALMFLSARKKVIILSLVVPIALVGLQFVPEKLINRAKTIETYEQDNSAMQRIQAWSVALNVALERPLYGAGFSMDHAPDDLWISYAAFLGDWNNRARAKHSIYFTVLGEHGFIGLGLFLGLMIATLVTLSSIKRKAQETEETKWMASYADALRIGIIGYAVSGAFLSLSYFDLYYTYVALAAVLLREVKVHEESNKKSTIPAIA